MGGGTIVTDEYIRVTPAEKSRTGSIWSQRPVYFDFWEVTLSFKIGGGGSTGADGMAFWYTLQPRNDGPAFGSIASFTGLGVFIDTFDNDGYGDNPRISVATNDGSWEYDGESDGKKNELASCRVQLRNLETKLRISYFNSKIQVAYNIPSYSNSWTACAVVSGDLPKNGYFGITAATGGLADNHDLLGFETFQLIPREDSQLNVNEKQEQEQTQQQEQQQQQQESVKEESQDQQLQPPYRQQQQQYQQPPQQQNQQYEQQNQQYQQPPQQQQQYQQPPQQNQQYQQPPQQQQQYQQNQQYQQPPQQQQQYQQPPQQQNQQYEQQNQQYQQQPPQQNQQYQSSNNAQEQCDTSQQSILQSLSEEMKLLKETQSQIQKILQNLEGSVRSLSSVDLSGLVQSNKKLENDIFQLTQKVDNVQQQQSGSSSGNTLQEIRNMINNKIVPSSDSGNRQLSSISNTLNSLSSKIDSSKVEQQRGFTSLRDIISDASNNDSGWGFWVFVALFQVVFAVGFFGWKKYQDSKMKLY